MYCTHSLQNQRQKFRFFNIYKTFLTLPLSLVSPLDIFGSISNLLSNSTLETESALLQNRALFIALRYKANAKIADNDTLMYFRPPLTNATFSYPHKKNRGMNFRGFKFKSRVLLVLNIDSYRYQVSHVGATYEVRSIVLVRVCGAN